MLSDNCAHHKEEYIEQILDNKFWKSLSQKEIAFEIDCADKSVTSTVKGLA